jgi:hypothetical protein
MGSVGICRRRERNLGFTRSSRHRYNIWTYLLVVIVRRSIRATNRSPPSLNDERQTRFAALVSRSLNPAKVRRNADALALAPKERFAVIIDAKVRSAGYVLGTEDRKFWSTRAVMVPNYSARDTKNSTSLSLDRPSKKAI